MVRPTYKQSIATHGLFLRELKRLGTPTGTELSDAVTGRATKAAARDESFDFVFRAGATSYELIAGFVERGFIEAVSIPGGHRPRLAWEWNTARIRITSRGLHYLKTVESEAAEEMKLFDDDSEPVDPA